jgi:hypothetical protein
MLKRIFLLIFMGILCVTLATQPSWAQGKGKGKGKGKQNQQNVQIIFRPGDRDIIRGFFRDRYSNLPPGLAKRHGNLPPGLQKHLERDGTLPPGLQKRLDSFPPELEARLPRLPDIYRRGTIGSDAVIIDRRTQRIMDIIHDIFAP